VKLSEAEKMLAEARLQIGDVELATLTESNNGAWTIYYDLKIGLVELPKDDNIVNPTDDDFEEPICVIGWDYCMPCETHSGLETDKDEFLRLVKE